jgi:hypothetical protein
MNFSTLFSKDLKSASDSAFFDTHIKMLKKIFLGSYYHFLPTLKPNAHKMALENNKLKFFFQT